MKKSRTKFPHDREIKSKALTESRVRIMNYTTDPVTDISIRESLPTDVVDDIRHAIDEVLAFHGL